MRRPLATLVLTLLFALRAGAVEPAPAQPASAVPQPDEPAPGVGDDSPAPLSMDMSRDGPPGARLPHAREGSGTSWMPDSSPMFGYHWMLSGWMVMLHDSLIAGYDDQGSARGSRRFVSTNWVMGMASHSLFGGELTLRSMLSAEPLTLAGATALPLLLQTGETYGGIPLHDQQHPHDLFMEVAALYRHALFDGAALELYGAPSGEPALGPTAFMHRVSAMSNPFPPITHHWMDSTHISFPVITVGLYNQWVKLEGSLFHGREPDENRWNFDWGPLDSWSLRASANPLREMSVEVSWGYLHSPEALRPLQDEHRVIASAQWTRDVFAGGNLAAIAAWGRKYEPGATTDSLLLEAQLDLDGFDVPFLRLEWVEKLGEDLVIAGDPDAQYKVSSLVFGYSRRLPQLGPLVPIVGIAINVGLVPASLESAYGTRSPMGGYLFFGLQPPRLHLGG